MCIRDRVYTLSSSTVDNLLNAEVNQFLSTYVSDYIFADLDKVLSLIHIYCSAWSVCGGGGGPAGREEDIRERFCLYPGYWEFC